MLKDSINIKTLSPKEHICVSQQFSKEYLFEVFDLAKDIEENLDKYKNILSGKIACLLFYEPSTRTRLSFESAINRLGGVCMVSENASQFSSAIKGETIEDTIEMVNNYADFVIIRHTEDDIINKIINKTKIPYINAGTGKTQHPTQTLLDLYTIYRNFGRLDNLVLSFCGDLLRSRTVDSLIYTLSKFNKNKFYFVSPNNSQIKDDLKSYIDDLKKDNSITYTETEDMISSMIESDVFYMTRIQKERFDSQEEYIQTKGKYILNNKNINLMKDSAIIMHPLPRVDEISSEIDNDKRAKYFEQAKNGLYIRMAVMKILNDTYN